MHVGIGMQTYTNTHSNTKMYAGDTSQKFCSSKWLKFRSLFTKFAKLLIYFWSQRNQIYTIGQHYYVWLLCKFFIYLIEGHPVLFDCPPVDSKNTLCSGVLFLFIFSFLHVAHSCVTHTPPRGRKKRSRLTHFSPRAYQEKSLPCGVEGKKRARSPAHEWVSPLYWAVWWVLQSGSEGEGAEEEEGERERERGRNKKELEGMWRLY